MQKVIKIPFFPNLVNRRRKRLQIKIIQKSKGECLERKEKIVKKAIKFYQDKFTWSVEGSDFTLLNWIPSLVTQENNENIALVLRLEEVKVLVFKLYGTNGSGPDRMNDNFFQSCWDIVGSFVHNIVKAFLREIHRHHNS